MQAARLTKSCRLTQPACHSLSEAQKEENFILSVVFGPWLFGSVAFGPVVTQNIMAGNERQRVNAYPMMTWKQVKEAEGANGLPEGRIATP